MEAKLQSLRSHGARSPLGLRSLPTAAHDQLAELQARGAEERRRREPAPEPEPLWVPRALPETTPEQLAGRRAATDRLAARVVAGERHRLPGGARFFALGCVADTLIKYYYL